MSKNVETLQWWSIPQAIVWIVGHDLALTIRAATVADMEALEAWEEMPAPVSSSKGEPPISRAAAPGELIREAIAGRIEIRGHYKGTGKSQPVPMQNMRRPVLYDHRDGPAITDEGIWGGGKDTWTNLWLPADECRKCWPSLDDDSKACYAHDPEVVAVRGNTSSLRHDSNGHAIGQPPPQFQSWVQSRKNAGCSIIALDGADGAWEAMKEVFPERSPARDTVNSWVKTLPEERQAKRGTPPSRARNTTDRD